MVRIGWLIVLLCIAPRAVAQELRVFASVDRTTVGLDETLAFTVEIQGTGISSLVRPDPPSTDGLVLAQPFPSQSTQTSIVNGVVSQSIGFTWYLRPSREGTGTISSVKVSVAGRDYATQAITIKVVPHGPGNQTPPSTRQDPFAAFRTPAPGPAPGSAPGTAPGPAQMPGDRDLFIRVVPSLRNALQGEQVTLRYELYFREGIQLRQSRLTDSWDAEGFWREELDVDTRPVPRAVVEGGLRYNTITLKRAAVFPTRAGTLAIDPLKIETEAVLPTRSRDPIAQLFALRSRYVPVELESQALSVRVALLPDGAPAGFAGAVGQYRMSVRFDRTEVAVGSSVTLTVTVQGTGNIATLSPPTFELPGAFERYEPRETLDIDRSGEVLRGSKTFEYVLVARSHGRFELPAIDFPYFDPATGRYAVDRSDPVLITVTGSTDAMPVARATAGGLPVDDIAGPVLSEVDWVRTDRTPLHRSAWPYALILLPAGIVAALWITDRRARNLAANPAISRLKQAHPLARKHLARAGSLLAAGEERPFYEELARALLGFIGNRLDVSEHGMTRERLASVLIDAGVDEPLPSDLVAFLESCDLARFSPVVPIRDQMESDRDRASDLLVRLDTAFRASRP